MPASLCTPTTETYGPDSIWNAEVGEKAKLLDNNLVLNADFYYIKWKEVQQVVNQNCGYPLTENAGDAASYGPEIEITARVTPELTITLAGTYTHAALTSVNPFLVQNTSIHSGTPILNVPKYTESASVTYTKPLMDGMKLVARVSNSYVGPATDIAYTYETLSPYDLVAARVGLVTDKWSAYLFGDNLTNKHAELGVNTSSFAWQAPSLVRTSMNRPRAIGLDLIYHFLANRLESLRCTAGTPSPIDASRRVRQQAVLDEHRRVTVVGRLFPGVGITQEIAVVPRPARELEAER